MAVITPWAINADGGLPAYDAANLRRHTTGLLLPGDDTLHARQGVFHPDSLALTVLEPLIAVSPGLCTVTTAAGSYVTGLDAEFQDTLDPRDATNPRVDIVVMRVYDDDEDGSAQRMGAVEYIAGTAAPSPVAPATPAGSMLLWTLDVPADGGGVIAATDNRRFTTTNGGVVTVLDQADRDTLPLLDGLLAFRLDTQVVEVVRSGAWAVLVPEFGAWLNITAQTGYTATDAQCRMEPGGIVRLRGSVARNTGILVLGEVAFNIPSANRPPSSRQVAASSGAGTGSAGAARLAIFSSGNAQIQTTPTNGATLFLDGLTYTV